MSNIDPNSEHTTEVRTTYGANGSQTTEIRRVEVRSSNSGWWVAGGVSVAAIVAVAAFLLTQPAPNTASDQAASIAAEQGRTQGLAEGAQAAAVNQANAQAATQSAQIAAQGEADRAAASRQAAEAAADRSARNANGSGRDASDTVDAPPANPPPSN